MSTEQPDPIGDRLDRILDNLEELEDDLRAVRDNIGQFVDEIQGNEVAFTFVLAEALTKIVRQQHELMVILEHRWGNPDHRGGG